VATAGQGFGYPKAGGWLPKGRNLATKGRELTTKGQGVDYQRAGVWLAKGRGLASKGWGSD